ncbi:MAG: chromosome segregation protein SMC, partial [Parachlamydiaceae bacterium]|nr:chromosome segregation protein SMC [Parachlamydiaceae bacterium]
SEFHIEMLDLDKNIRRHEMVLVEVNFGLQRLHSDLEKNKKEAGLSQTELSSLQQIMEKQEALVLELTDKHQIAKEKTLQLKGEVTALEATTQEKNGFLQEQKLFLQEVDSTFSGAAKLLQKNKHDIHVLEIQETESLRQERRLEEELQLAADFQAQLAHKSREWDQALGAIELALQVTSAAYLALEESVTQKKADIIKLEQGMTEILHKGKKHEQEQHQVALLIAQLNAASRGIEEDLQTRYNLSLEQAEQLPPPAEKSVDAMERKLRDWRREFEDAGDINMTSIDECAKHQVRYEFLNQQIEDLAGSKEGLMEIIRELDIESRKLFKETFATISANFKKNFAILFNGGEADLQFTESSDLLEAGIEIIAKPPGKQMRSISLLSGGEKCLTALALLFAIFEVKSGPFCILDEIDAPLDDSNVDRFANIVKQFIHRCQFIIITHNKQTMAIADVLYGVTMEEKGTSKLLQMEMDQAERAQLV